MPRDTLPPFPAAAANAEAYMPTIMSTSYHPDAASETRGAGIVDSCAFGQRCRNKKARREPPGSRRRRHPAAQVTETIT